MTQQIAVLAPRTVDEDSPTGVTTNAYVAALDWCTRGMGNKTIVLTNTDVANSLTFQLLTKAAYLTGVAIPNIAPTTLIAGDSEVITLDNAYAEVILELKDTVAGSHANWQIDYIGQAGS